MDEFTLLRTIAGAWIFILGLMFIIVVWGDKKDAEKREAQQQVKQENNILA